MDGATINKKRPTFSSIEDTGHTYVPGSKSRSPKSGWLASLPINNIKGERKPSTKASLTSCQTHSEEAPDVANNADSSCSKESRTPHTHSADFVPTSNNSKSSAKVQLLDGMTKSL